MTVHDAITAIQQVGTIRAENGKLKIRFPQPERARLQPAIEALRRNRNAALEATSGTATVPPPEAWPESLRELADERAVASGDAQSARKEVWISWYEWKAQTLNRLFHEQGSTGAFSNITAETVKNGILRTHFGPKNAQLGATRRAL